LTGDDNKQKVRVLNALTDSCTSELAQLRWLVTDQHGSPLPAPFLVTLVLWLVVIFLCAVSVASAILLILELDRPFEGPLRISDLPLREAIAEMSRP